MHPNPAFRQEPSFLHLNMARWRGFGTLVLSGDPVPLISHVPFILEEDGAALELHLVRSNPIARRVTSATPAVMVVNGPDGYVSPDWYDDPTHSQVPTWNYVAVHMTGQLEPGPEDGLRDHLDRLSASFEDRLAPKTPWHADKMPVAKLRAMMRAIGVYRFAIEAIDGTWKLNQNKDDDQRARAAAHMRHSPIGHETENLAGMMMGLGPRTPDI